MDLVHLYVLDGLVWWANLGLFVDGESYEQKLNICSSDHLTSRIDGYMTLFKNTDPVSDLLRDGRIILDMWQTQKNPFFTVSYTRQLLLSTVFFAGYIYLFLRTIFVGSYDSVKYIYQGCIKLLCICLNHNLVLHRCHSGLKLRGYILGYYILYIINLIKKHKYS